MRTITVRLTNNSPGENNTPLDEENPSSVWSPETDNGTVEPFKYSFALAHKRIESGGWTRQVTERELPISKSMAGVEMRLVSGGVRELHWHTSAEWAFMIYGNARITAVDAEGRSFVNDVAAGDLWLFPGGIPHSIQGLGPNGCKFLLVFNDGSFNEFETFLLSDWFKHTPKEVLAKNFGVPAATFDNVPQKELFIFASELPRPLAEEQKAAAAGTGAIDGDFIFRASTMPPTKVTAGGEVRIVEKKNFPATDIAAAIVRVKPDGLRELHWHPLSDEWQYYVSGKGRMTVFQAGGKARTFDFQGGDVGYIRMSTAALHRKHRNRRPGVPRGVPHRHLPGHLRSRVAGAHTRSSGRSAPQNRRRLSRQNSEEGSSHHSAVKGRSSSTVKSRTKPFTTFWLSVASELTQAAKR